MNGGNYDVSIKNNLVIWYQEKSMRPPITGRFTTN